MNPAIPTPFQHDKPLFVKVPFTAKGHNYKQGDQLKWKEKNLDPLSIEILYKQGFLMHDATREEALPQVKIGDGLDELDIDALNALVVSINAKVSAKVKTNKEFLQKKCPTSKVKDKQIGLIRRWRSAYGNMEN